jgi:hypothetical protein
MRARAGAAALALGALALGLAIGAGATEVRAQDGTGSASVAPASAERLRIVVISDLNERYGDTFHRPEVHAAAQAVIGLRPDLILVTGDMVAGQREGLDYEAMWQGFRDAVDTPLAQFPLAVAPGNHDAASSERFRQEREIYSAQWGLERLFRGAPIEPLDVSGYPLRYSFRAGPVQLIALDATDRDALRDGDQLDWLEAQLAAADDAETPLRVLFGHVPFYPLAQDREGSYLLRDRATRERVEALFVRYDVDLVIGGHHHAYYPGRHPDDDLRVLGMGCLGGGPRRLIGDERPLETDDPTERSFVVIEVEGTAIASVEAYHGPGFGAGERVDPSVLPAEVGWDDVRVIRWDLAPVE